MLVQFVVENFLSFRDKQILSMRAPEPGAGRVGAAFQDGRQQTVRVGGEEILRCAVLYGANASGKSNLVHAIDFARSLVLAGTPSQQRIPRRPFKLDPACVNQPSRFELVFCQDDSLFHYGFVLDSERVRAEWLYRGPEHDQALLFRRELDAASDQHVFEVGEALATDPARRQFYDFLHQGTRTNQLFLSEAKERNAPELAPPLTWFRNQLRIVHPNMPDIQLSTFVDTNPGFCNSLAALLARVDTGITGIRTKRTSLADLPESLRAQMLELLQKKRLSFTVGDRAIQMNQQGDLESVSLITSHGDGAGEVTFDLHEESDGTRRFMHLATVLHSSAERDTPRVFVMDELDLSLHPLLTRFFLQELLRQGDATSGNQLICTTHDTNLLDLNLLPPSSIWFVEKDRAGSSHLYSLDEFDEDQLAALRDHTEEGYLAGRFGAIPFFGDRRRLVTEPEGAGEG